MSTIRIPRKKQEQPTFPKDDAEIRAERSEEAEFEDAKKSEDLPEHYRTKIDKY
jgi:hypothetical protein